MKIEFQKIIAKSRYISMHMLGGLFGSPGNRIKAIRTVVCKKDDILFYADTPNTIIYYKSGHNEGFFRECRAHVCKRKYLESLIDDYCKYVLVDNNEECKKIIMKKLSSSKNFWKFFHMGEGTSRYSRITYFRKTGDSRVIGIDPPYPEWFRNQLLKLVQYAWGPLDEYLYCWGQIGGYQKFNSSKSFVTKAVADLIGESEIIPLSEYICLELDGVKRYGISVAKAEGEEPQYVKNYKIHPNFQRSLINLNILDLITYQKDHRPGNYFVEIRDNKIYTLNAFDNDCPTTLLLSTDVTFKTYTGCVSYIDQDGMLICRYFDRVLFERLNEINNFDIINSLRGEINIAGLLFLMLRLNKIRNAINRSVKVGRTELIDRDCWSIKTINKEIMSNELTYFKYYVTQFCNEGLYD